MSPMLSRINDEPEHVRLNRKANRLLVLMFALLWALPVVMFWGR